MENFPNITFRSTIDQYTVEHTFENYLFAISKGFKNIFMMPNGREKWSEEAKEKFKIELDKIYRFMGLCFDNNTMPPINFSSINESFKNILERDKAAIQYKDETEIERLNRLSQVRNVKRCGLGTTGCSIGYNGNIYGCQEQASCGIDSIFYIGNIYNGIDINKHNTLLFNYAHQGLSVCENKKICENCILRINCYGHACPSSSQDLFQNFNTDNEMHCLWFQHMCRNAAVLMKVFTDKNNNTFKKYLDNNCQFNKYFPNERGEKNGCKL